jgi:hypothetical protein
VSHGYGEVKNTCLDLKKGFLFGGLSPPNKKRILSVLCGSAVNPILDPPGTFNKHIEYGIISSTHKTPIPNYRCLALTP